MIIKSARLTFYIPYAHSLKDKRQVAKSLMDKTRQKFNVSIAEVDTQDMHQSLTLGLALVSGQQHQAQKMMDEIIRFLERHTEAELLSIEQEDYE